MHEQLLGHRSRPQGGAVETNKRPNRKRAKIKAHSSYTNAADPWAESEAKLRRSDAKYPCRDQMPELVRKHTEDRDTD
jgi:hypothetical protein